ncbi:MAG: hypothetical protein LBU11_01870 [Zoogloeaceae bacterium]|jgi:Tfp pilus assembly protein PilW|nr:hypothetical protein [Zoogloeaceae bacterium]
MDDLTYTLRQLCLRNRDGSFATQADRQRSLALMVRQLREAGFRQTRATSLKGRHWRTCAGGPRKSARRAFYRRTIRNWVFPNVTL